MKTLLLLRHAKSGWDDAVARDFDRPLNAKGKRAARTMGAYLRDQDIGFDRAIASPALRVVETLDAIAEGYGRSLAPDLDRRIYLAAATTLLDIVHEQPDAADRLLLSGHNPGMEELVLLLVPDAEDDRTRDAVEEKYPTAALAEIALDVDRWTDVTEGSGRLLRFVRPRDLDPTLGPDSPV